MQTAEKLSLYERDQIRRVTGPAIRPGGVTLTEKALNFCGFSQGSRVLDAGCGCGETVRHLRGKWNISAFGVDLSKMMLSEGVRSESLPLVYADAGTLPCKSGSLDGVICECVLSVMTDQEKTLSEFHRALKKGGYLILSDIYLREKVCSSENMGQEVSVKSCFGGAVTREKLISQVKSAGFTNIVWEDHTKLLKELAARFVFEYGSLKQFWEQVFPCGCTAGSKFLSTRGKPGYSLLIARKN